LTLLGAILAAFKTVLTNVLQSPGISSFNSHKSIHIRLPRLHPLALLCTISPLAFIQAIFIAYRSGELSQVRRYMALDGTFLRISALLCNGCLAFALNVISFSANQRVGALSMTVAGDFEPSLAFGRFTYCIFS
jgi:ABC-type arginine/histidine transport system permease subunit